MTLNEPPPSPNDPAARRPFLVSLAAIASGAAVTLFPLFVGAGVLFDPLRRRGQAVPEGESGGEKNAAPAAKYVRICTLDSLPADGVPRPFPVHADVVDAWTRIPNQRVGLIFLSRTDEADGPKIAAVTATCPHLGCAVEFNTGENQFECPCHASAFAKDGEKLFGPSLRGLDTLSAKIETKGEQKEIWVAFEKFRTGIAEREPLV